MASPEATVLGTGERTSALNAILANGAMVRFLDLNDVQSSASRPGPRHGHNSEIYPVLLALGEREGASGRDLLMAAWLSYEISTRFTESIPGRSLEFRGWNLDTRASFVVPLIAGRLLGLNADQIANAVGIALSRGLVLEVMDHPSEVNSMAKNLRYPLTAHLGVTAAYLARNGLTGPARALEGGDGFIERVLDGEYDLDHLLDPARQGQILHAGMKRFAACFATHGHLNATLDLVTEHDLKPEQVTAVRIKTTTRGARHTGDPSRKHPQNKETADHSTYYVQAALITDRALGPGPVHAGTTEQPGDQPAGRGGHDRGRPRARRRLPVGARLDRSGRRNHGGQVHRAPGRVVGEPAVRRPGRGEVHAAGIGGAGPGGHPGGDRRGLVDRGQHGPDRLRRQVRRPLTGGWLGY